MESALRSVELSPVILQLESDSVSCSVVSDSLQPPPRSVAHQAPLSMGFFRQEYWSRQPFPSPEDLLNLGTEPRSPTLQADSLPADTQGKPKNIGLVAYPFSSRSSQSRNQTRVSCIAGRFLPAELLGKSLIKFIEFITCASVSLPHGFIIICTPNYRNHLYCMSEESVSCCCHTQFYGHYLHVKLYFISVHPNFSCFQPIIHIRL